MSEVKIYSGTVNGVKRIGITLFRDSDTTVFTYLDEQGRRCVIEYELDADIDLTELTFHPKGEGVWVEGVTAEELRTFVENVKVNPFAVYYTDKRYGKNSNEIREQLLAQLSQPTEEASAPKRKCAVEGCEYDHDAALRTQHALKAMDSPAKVSVELTEEAIGALRDLIEYITLSDEQTISDRYSPKAYDAIYMFKKLLTPAPMPEQEEPKEFGAIVEADYKDHKRKRWLRNPISGCSWLSAFGDDATWYELRNVVILSKGLPQ